MAIATTVGATLALLAKIMAAVTTPGMISFDHGSLDTFDALGLNNHILAVPKQSLPAYLAHYAGDDYLVARAICSTSYRATLTWLMWDLPRGFRRRRQ